MMLWKLVAHYRSGTSTTVTVTNFFFGVDSSKQTGHVSLIAKLSALYY
jgi:hypothetical protein